MTESRTATTLLALHLLRRRRQRRRTRQSHLARRYDHRISRRALLLPSMSAFQFLFDSGCDQSLITLTGFDHVGFQSLLVLFAPLYNMYTPYTQSGLIGLVDASRSVGRPRSMNATQCLAMYLMWSRTRGAQNVLGLVFGVTGSVASLFIRFARRLIIKALANDAAARVRLPSRRELAEHQQVIAAKYPLLRDVCAVMDGLKVRLEANGTYEVQSIFYNGWTHDHYVTNVLVFAPNGRIIAASLNAPGCLHDSVVADYGGVYKVLKRLYDETRARVVVDSAFASDRYEFMIKCGTLDDVADQGTQLRQSAEWGMRAVQASFPRLKDRISYDEMGERKLILLSTVLLFNFRSSTVGMNQILSTFYWDALARDPMNSMGFA